MWKHYLKIALRNLWKYKTQTVLSLIGLSVGFICFSLSMYWLHYERSFDNFHPHADRIYVVQLYDSTKADPISRISAYPLGTYLKQYFPEIEEVTQMQPTSIRLQTTIGVEWFMGFHIDTSFVNVFQVSDKNFKLPYFYDNNSSMAEMPQRNLPVVITDRAAKKISPTEFLEGKEIELTNKKTLYIEKEIAAWPTNTNISFDFLLPFSVADSWRIQSYHTYILLKEGVDGDALNKKLQNIKIEELHSANLRVIISPLRTFKKEYPKDDQHIKHEYIYLFAIAGLLIALSGLFNYIMLFINRIRMRSREFALRQVNGASGWHLLSLVLFEFSLIITGAILLGLVGIHYLLPAFKELSSINLPNQSIYLNSFKYIMLLVASMLLLSLLPIYYYQRETLHQSTQKGHQRDWFYKICVLLQLMIGMGFVFCSFILFSQTQYLMNRDIGFNRYRVAKVNSPKNLSTPIDLLPYADKIKELSTIEAVLKHESIMVWDIGSISYSINDGKKGEEQRLSFLIYAISSDFIPFFDIQFAQGENFNPEIIEDKDILINEAAANLVGIDRVYTEDSPLATLGFKVVGIVKNFHTESPEIRVEPLLLGQTTEMKDFVYRYKEGMKAESEKQLTEVIRKDHPHSELEFTYMEDTYRGYYTSERALFVMVLATTLVCVLISIFGVYSMVALICTRRRKEIAIRKANGAKTFTIFWQIFKEYFYLLLIACVLTFPIVHSLMLLWLEHYANRITIGWSIYILLFAGALLVITLTVFYQVWQAARQNPAEILKSE